MANLLALNGMNPGQTFPLERDRTVLGRSPESDIVLDPGAASRFHAHICRKDGAFYVEDLKSRYGTRVNGELIHGLTMLQNRDELRIVDLLFLFENNPASPSRHLAWDEVLDDFVPESVRAANVPFTSLGEEKVSLLELCRHIRHSLDSHQLVFYSGPSVGDLQWELLAVDSEYRELLGSGFRSLIVLDAGRGLDESGNFQLPHFYAYVGHQLMRAFGLPPMDAFHEQDIPQFLKDEKRSVICLMNVQLVPAADRQRLRGLTQTAHPSLVMYERSSIRAWSVSRDAGTVILDDSEIEDDFESSHLPPATGSSEVRVKALLGLTANMGQSLELSSMLGTVLDALMQVFPQADRAFVGLQLRKDRPLTPAAFRLRSSQSSSSIKISGGIVRHVMAAREAILSTDAMDDPRVAFTSSPNESRIRAVMCAPLLDGEDNVLGVVQIDSLHAGSTFQFEDLQLLADVAPQAALAVQVWKLHQQALQQAAIQRELELAAQVQCSLLPASPPKIDKYEFFAFYRSAQKVGGDYYAYVELPDGRLAIVVADVSGRGIAAALIMAELAGELKTLLTSESSAAEVVRRANVGAARWHEKFITLILAVLEPDTHQVALVNAGHMAPLWRHSDGHVEAVGEHARRVALGIDEDATYEEFQFVLERGDSLTFFTDGITEASLVTGELYGEGRLRQALERASGSAEDIGQCVLDDLAVGLQDQRDDICLVCMRRVE